jgi:hypothetical protein
MSYVPVLMWVDDTAEGPVTDAVHVRPCPTCDVPVILDKQDEHDAAIHPPPPEVTPH